jgi:isoleucyl-tRNA synthetase
MAPGCGPEDQEVGTKYGLPAFNEVDTKGYFNETMGKFKGWIARTDDKKFIDYFDEKGALVAKQKYRHEYPFHERSHAPVIFRTTRQWFLGVEKLREEMRKWNREVKWVPEWAGTNTFDSWLANLRDIGLTRQMYWGTPVPIWKCASCGTHIVVGSLDELKKLSKKTPKKMHKPWIDEITIPCQKCKGTMFRIPDVCDVWVDAGCTSFISLYYPKTDKYFKKYWPCDFILEAKDQIRGWFNLLFDTAAISGLGKPFKACYMTGWTVDSLGRKQSKSLGNVIDPYEVTEKYGVDAVRYYMMGSAQPGVDMNYNFEDLSAKARNITVLWNVGNWLLDFAENNKLKNFDKAPELGLEEKYILSKLHKTIRKVTDLYDNYKLNEIPQVIENFYLELSRSYIKWMREKSNSGDEKDKYRIGYTMYTCLLNTLKMAGTVMPFMCEKMYQQMRKQFRIKEESIHLFDWPEADDDKINEKLEDYFGVVDVVGSAILSVRDRHKTGIRWPLSKVLIYAEDKLIHDAVEELSVVIKQQCNVKAIEFMKEKPDWLKLQFRINQASMNKKFKQLVPSIVGRLVQHSPQSVQARLDKEGKFQLEMDGKMYEITEDDVFFEEQMPDIYAGSEFDGGSVYVNLEQNEELLAEGFMRETVRRIQDMRKEAKLEKKQKANAVVVSDAEMVKMVEKYKKQMEERTGCRIKLAVGDKTAEKLNKVMELKGRKISVGLSY